MRYLLTIVFVASSIASYAETIRVAVFNAALNRENAGDLIASLESGDDPQINAVLDVIEEINPDILLMNEVDWDSALKAHELLQKQLGERGVAYPYIYAPEQNVGKDSGIDLNADGQTGTPNDAFGYGAFPGQYAMALFSRYEIDAESARDFSDVLWRDLKWAELPKNEDGTPFLSDEQLEAFRFSSKGHWDVPIKIGNKVINIFASHPTPPVFDGPEDLNGLRNAAEIDFWNQYIKGDQEFKFEGENFVILGDLNADSNDGDGRRDVIARLLANPQIQDPMQKSEGAIQASKAQGGSNGTHSGDPALDTADWNDESSGNLRVDYALPSAGLKVVDSGVYWPDVDGIASMASDHRLVWVDVELPE